MQRKKKEAQDSSYWLFRPLEDKKRDWLEITDNWVDDYWESKAHSHRKLIVNAVAYTVTKGSESLLEIGCNCGPNIAAIREIVNMRDDRIAGIDVNPDAIRKAKEMLPAVRWEQGNAVNLPFPDQSYDTILCDAVLMYAQPEEIEHIADEINRVARKFVILLEWGGKTETGELKDFHWCRDYAKLFTKRGFIVDERMLTREEWDTKTWQKHGKLYLCHRP